MSESKLVSMWDSRYSSDTWFYGTDPNDFLAQHADHFPAGALVLCLAEGEGRNAVFLAGRGAVVTAVDGSAVGLQNLKALATSRGVEVETVHSDLAVYDLGEAQWDGIVSIWCHLPQPLRTQVHAAAVRGLKPGGWWLQEAYTPAQLQFKTGGPPDVAMLMTLEALRNELRGLEFVIGHEIERHIEEGKGHRGNSAVVQVLARKPMPPG